MLNKKSTERIGSARTQETVPAERPGGDMRILPLRNQLLVRFIDQKTVTPGGIYMVRDPRIARPAEVIACGPEVRDVQVGQTVIANSVAGASIGDDLLLPETAILGTL